MDATFAVSSSISNSGNQGIIPQPNALDSAVENSSAMSAEEPVTKKSEVIMNPFQALSGMDPKKGCTSSYSCSRPKATSHLPGGLSNTRVIRGEKTSKQPGATFSVNRSRTIKEALDLPSGISSILSEKHLDLTLRDVLKTLPAGEVTLIVLRYLSAHLPAIGSEKDYAKENECTSSGTNSITTDKNTFVSSILSAGAGVVSVSDHADGGAVSRTRKSPIVVLQSSSNNNDPLWTEDVLEVDVEAETETEVQIEGARTELECDLDAHNNIPVSYWTATNSPEKIRFERNPAYTDIAKNVRDNVRENLREDVWAVSVSLPVCNRNATSAVENEVSMYMNMEAMEAHNISENMGVNMTENMDCNNDEGERFEINSNFSTCNNSSEDKNGHNSHVFTEMTKDPISLSEEVLNDEECCIIQPDLSVNTVIRDLADTCQAVSTSHDCDSNITNHSAATLTNDKVLTSITASDNEHERIRDTDADIDIDLTLNMPENVDLIEITEKSANSEFRIVESVVTTVTDPMLSVSEILIQDKGIQESNITYPLLELDSQINNVSIEIVPAVIRISSVTPILASASIPTSISASIPTLVSLAPSFNGMIELLNHGTRYASRTESSVPLGLFHRSDTIDMIVTTAPLLCSYQSLMPPTDITTEERDVALSETDKVICNALPVGNGPDRVSTATVNIRLDLTVEDSTRGPTSCTQPVTSEGIPLLRPLTTIEENGKVEESNTANHTVLKTIEEWNTVKAVMPLRGSEVPSIIKEKCFHRETISMMVRHTDKGSAPQASFISSSFKNVQRKTPLNATSSVPSTQSTTATTSSSSVTEAAIAATVAAAATTTTTTAAAVSVHSDPAFQQIALSRNSISLANPAPLSELKLPSILTPWIPFSSSSSSPLPSPSSSSSSFSSSLPLSTSSSSSFSSSSSSPQLSIILPTPLVGANSISLLPCNTKESSLLSKMSDIPSYIDQHSRISFNSVSKDKAVVNMDNLSDSSRYHSASEPSYYDDNDQDHTGTTDSEMINDSNDSSMISKKSPVVFAAPLNALLDTVRYSDSTAPPTKKSTSNDTPKIPCNADIQNDVPIRDTGNGNGKKRPLPDNTQSGTVAEVSKKVQNVQNGPLHIPEKKKGISVWALNLARTTQKTDLRLVKNKKKISRKKMEQWLRAVAYLKTKNHYTPTPPEDVTPSVVTSHVPCNTVQPWRCIMCNHMMSVRSTNCSRCNHVCTHLTTSQPTGVLSVPLGTRVYPKPLTAHAKAGPQRVSALSHEKPPDRPPLEKPFEKPIEKNQASQQSRGSSQFIAVDDLEKNKNARIDNSEYICRSVEVHIPTERMTPRSADVLIVSKIPKGTSSSISSSASSNLSAKNAAHLATMHAAAAATAAASLKGLNAPRPANSVSAAAAAAPSSSSSSGSSSRTTAPSTSTSSSSSTLDPATSKIATATATAPSTSSETSISTSTSTANTSTSSLIPAPPSTRESSSESFIDLTNDDDEPCNVRKVHTTKQLENTTSEQTQQQRSSEPTSSSTHNHNSNNGNQKKRSHPSAFDNDMPTFSSYTGTKNKYLKSSEPTPKIQNHPTDRSRSAFQATFPPPPTFSSSSFVPTSSRGSSSSSSYNGSDVAGTVHTGQAPRPFQPPPYPPMPRHFQNLASSLTAPPSDKTNQNTRFCRRSVPLAKGNHSLQSIDSPESFNKLNVDDFSTG